MKKNVVFILIFLLYINNSFSYEKTFFSEWAKQEIETQDSDFFKTEECEIYILDNNVYICLSEFCFVFLTDNETYLKESDVGCASKQNHGQKIVSEIEKFKLGNFYTYVLDLNYDESLDLLNYTVSGMGVSIKAKSFITDETLFKSRIYKSFKNIFIKFCIINGKRGIGLQQPDENSNINWSFFYWSPSSQRYILDESVTQEQLANAYCPEDYFAYNGLKFSKLDSKLIEEDLRNLDKSQLRLMRNAVYARHGRTFKSVDLQSLWECCTWYKINPNYNDSLLTDIDKYNIELIQKYEAK